MSRSYKQDKREDYSRKDRMKSKKKDSRYSPKKPQGEEGHGIG